MRLVAIFLASCFWLISPLTYSSDGELSEQFLADLDQHFFAPENLDPAGEIKKELLLNDEYQAQTESLLEQLSTAVDRRANLTPLAKYGVVAKGDGGVSINLARNPGWATAYQILTLALPGKDEQTLYQLEDRGFRNSDLAAVRKLESIQKVRERMQAKSEKKVLALESKAKANRSARKSNSSLYRATMADVKDMRKQEKKSWTTKIRKKLDLQRQRILVSYALEKAITLSIYPEPQLTDEIIEKNVDAVIRRADYVRNNK